MGTWDEESATAAGYDYWAAYYDDGDPSTWLDEPFLLEHLKPFPGCRILDMGCGTGRYLRLLPSMNRVTGVDLSRNMLSRARQRMGMGGRKDVSLVQASVTCLPFHAGSFDRVISGLVIDHVASVEYFFRQLSEALAASGRAVVAAVHPDMQRITGSDINVRSGDEQVLQIPGHIHEVAHLLAAARDTGMTVSAMDAPLVTTAMLDHRPSWKRKVGFPALLLLALVKDA